MNRIFPMSRNSFQILAVTVALNSLNAIAFGQGQSPDHFAQPAGTTCDVTWRKVDNPHVISGTVTIPANQTVCVEPGVIVQWADNSEIDLLGQIIGTGASADRITFNYANTGPNRIEVIGTLDLQFADVNVILNINAGGSFICRNGNFGAVGRIEATSFNIDSLPTRFVQLEDTVFDSTNVSLNTELFAAGLTAILRNVTFRNNAFCFVGNAYIYFDNVTSQNSPITGLAFSQSEYQPLYLNNLTVTNSGDAGIYLGHGNFEIGPNVVIQNTEYPFSGKGGLMPGSSVPATGNRNNWFEVGQPNADSSMYPPIAVPYVIDSFSDIGSLQILPGAHFKARANFHFHTESGPVRILGLPDAPIVFEPFIAGQKWDGGQFNSGGDRMEYVTFDGSQRGVIDANSANGTFYVDNSIIRNNDVAISSPTGFFQGNLFTNNITAINARVRGSGKKNPNLFENNTTAVFAASGELPDARYDWWNSPTGPTHPQNPGGTGDLINGTAYFQPFRTTRPDTTDHPPVVRMPNVPHPRRATDAGNKVVLNWTASDDHQIVKQKILYSPARNARDDFFIIADNLPPTQREYELLIPATGFEVSGSPTFLRVVAIDDQGQEGWDEWYASTPAGEETGELQITANVAGQTFRGNQRVPLTWTVTAPFPHPPPDFTCYLVIDADRELIDVGGGSNGQSFLPPMMPVISTDSARFAVVANRGLNRQKWFFSEPFAIRPDSRWPDAAPQVTLLSPTAGQEFPAGSIVPITWTASDDEALRQFNIQVSTDAGRTWIHLAENLPPAATSYNWQTPSGAGANDVRIRVVAVDRRFQNSSDGATRVFRLTGAASLAPNVALTFPANNTTFPVGQSIFIGADASDSDGTIQRVEFYQTSNSTGISTPSFIGSDATAPYQIGWNRPSAQNYTITARAIDNRNAVTVSAPVTVTVQPGSPAPLPIGAPELSSPDDGQIFTPGANITLSALPAPSSYSTVRIEFYNGTTLLASDNAAPYEIVWSNVPAGSYTVFAKTIASNGAQAISKPADISVGTASTPTPTPSPTPTNTPIATPTPSSTPGPTATPSATPAPSPTPTATPSATPNPGAKAVNLSTRMRVQTGDNVGIGGFIITGSVPKRVLIRAIGPSLQDFGVPDVLADPMLELHGPGGFATILNDNWREDQEAEIQATGIPPSNDFESAIAVTLAPGAYTAIVRGNGVTFGVALVEVYDLNQGVASKLANLSTRAFISTGDNVVIAGFILGGNPPQAGDNRIVVRGIGPSLTATGVPNALADPTLELRDSNGALLRANNDWQNDPVQMAEIVAANLAPTNDLESAIAATLPPGSYTALLAGHNNGAGVGLVEVYDRGTQ